MSRIRPKERPLTPEELALSRRLLAEHGIHEFMNIKTIYVD